MENDPREWPGFRVQLDERWSRHAGVRAAEGDPTFPQRAVTRTKQGPDRARAALQRNAAGEEMTSAQVTLRRHMVRDARERNDPEQQLLARQIRMVPGGRATVLALIQRAARNHDREAIDWWNTYADLMPVDQKNVTLDDVCEWAGVTPDRLMAIVVSTAMRAGADAADLIAATTYPTIVHQTVKSAKRIGGQYAAIAQKDREHVLQHHKFIPAPGRSAVIVNNTAQAAAAAATEQPSVPAFSDSLNDAMAAHKTIQAELVEE